LQQGAAPPPGLSRRGSCRPVPPPGLSRQGYRPPPRSPPCLSRRAPDHLAASRFEHIGLESAPGQSYWPSSWVPSPRTLPGFFPEGLPPPRTPLGPSRWGSRLPEAPRIFPDGLPLPLAPNRAKGWGHGPQNQTKSECTFSRRLHIKNTKGHKIVAGVMPEMTTRPADPASQSRKHRQRKGFSGPQTHENRRPPQQDPNS
jgi:hypothetical protein